MKLVFLLAVLLASTAPKPPATPAKARSTGAAAAAREMIVVNQQLWCLTAAGKIVVYNTQGAKQKLPSVQQVTAQHIANDGTDVIAQLGTKLQRWNSSTGTWQELGNLTVRVFALAASSAHRVYAITPKGVWDISQNAFHLPTASPNNQMLLPRKGFSAPDTYFMDAQDNWWLGYGYGEWGGNIFTYSTKSSKFVKLEFNNFPITLNPIKSFFQLKEEVGVSAGLQHMMNNGAIATFHHFSAHSIYRSEKDIDTTSQESRWKSISELPYIGPASSGNIYFYANKGVFKGKAGRDLSKLRNWQLVFTPKLHWRNGQRDAVGSPMNVLKMLCLGDGKLALLTQDDGVGIWDGNSFNLLP
jgi:hypothetical protein